MKKLLTLFLLFSAFFTQAQESFFRGNNNYIRPVSFQAPATITSGLVLNLDAGNPASYAGTGTTWTNLITGNPVANFTLNSGVNYTAAYGGVLRFSDGGLSLIHI
jgi:hypothetical protein